MPFEELPALIVKRGANAGKPASKTTVTNYRRDLNKIATVGFDTVDKLIAEPNAVISAIDTLYPGTENKNIDKRRRAYSALMWALTNATDEQKIPYISAFRSNMRQY